MVNKCSKDFKGDENYLTHFYHGESIIEKLLRNIEIVLRNIEKY